MAVNKKTGNMTSPVQMETQQLFGLTVKWSHLLKPDMVYDSGHSVTVEMTDELEKLHKELKAQTGLKKVNGVKELLILTEIQILLIQNNSTRTV